MPRPLIIKVESRSSHADQSLRSSMDSLSMKPSKSQPILNLNGLNDHETTISHVKNLIDLYENPQKHKSNLTKSKSLPHLAIPKRFQRRVSQVEPIDKTPSVQKQDFKTVLSRFETEPNETAKKATLICKDLKDIKEQAIDLLKDYNIINESLWKKHVIRFLNSICSLNLPQSDDIINNNDKQIKKEAEEAPKVEKVKDLKNLFERQFSSSTMYRKPEGFYIKYFTHINTYKKVETPERKLSSSESSLSEKSEESRGDNKTGLKIMDLKSYFESNKDGPIKTSGTSGDLENGRTLSPLVVDVDSEDDEETNKTPIETINDLVHQIETLEDQIQDLSNDDTDEASRVNEDLIQILIKLDDIYGNDDQLLTQRKVAIGFVQQCIRLLRNKMRN
ncbi:hypothetical protein FQA39_LY03055 [Lamprigera yunnana]|nr:hypothetical protein FQA39_LY03055 [Lamprigera yunnana]